MANDTLAIIMAAGYGRRMGTIDVPKVMLPDREGRPFIADALTFLRYDKGIDFAVLSRREPSFGPLHDYLGSHPQREGFSVVYQERKPEGLHVLALMNEYARRGTFYDHASRYLNVIALPGDHKLTADQLNLDDLAAAHKINNSGLTMVFSRGWNSPKAHKDHLDLDKKGRIRRYWRESRDAKEPKIGEKVTGTGVWMLSTQLVGSRKKAAISALGFWGVPFLSGYSNAFPYFIEPGWDGVRDTPDTIGK